MLAFHIDNKPVNFWIILQKHRGQPFIQVILFLSNHCSEGTGWSISCSAQSLLHNCSFSASEGLLNIYYYSIACCEPTNLLRFLHCQCKDLQNILKIYKIGNTELGKKRKQVSIKLQGAWGGEGSVGHREYIWRNETRVADGDTVLYLPSLPSRELWNQQMITIPDLAHCSWSTGQQWYLPSCMPLKLGLPTYSNPELTLSERWSVCPNHSFPLLHNLNLLVFTLFKFWQRVFNPLFLFSQVLPRLLNAFHIFCVYSRHTLNTFRSSCMPLWL